MAAIKRFFAKLMSRRCRSEHEADVSHPSNESTDPWSLVRVPQFARASYATSKPEIKLASVYLHEANVSHPSNESTHQWPPVLVPRHATSKPEIKKSRRYRSEHEANVSHPSCRSEHEANVSHPSNGSTDQWPPVMVPRHVRALYATSKPEIKLASVYFTCSDIGPDVLSKDDIQGYIHEYLVTLLAEDPERASALMIQTLNRDKEAVRVCVETLCKYLDNLIDHPEHEKFRKIRFYNRAFQDRVFRMQGSEEFLRSVGFLRKTIRVDGTNDEDFYILSDELAQDTNRFMTTKCVLSTVQPLRSKLYRDTRVFHASTRANTFRLHNDFYNLTLEGLKRAQKEASEREFVLRTRVMRENDKRRQRRWYRCTLVRVRFPSGTLLQGTFSAMDRLSTLYEFIRENVQNNWIPFVLRSETGRKLTAEDLSLTELDLAPTAVVDIAWDTSIQADIAAQRGSHKEEYLKPEVLAQIQEL